MKLSILNTPSENRFDQRVRGAGVGEFNGLSIRTVQVNVGLKCNLACHHCHVESSPKRTEEMTWETMELVLNAAKKAQAATIDITGGNVRKSSPVSASSVCTTIISKSSEVTIWYYNIEVTSLESTGKPRVPDLFFYPAAKRRQHFCFTPSRPALTRLSVPRYQAAAAG